jgi:hypothetical protein
MMKPTQPTHPRFYDPRGEEVDGLLTRFFRSEMPEPWPACPRVASESKPPPTVTWRRFFRVPGRLALAAAVAGLVIGYLALASWFPEPQRAVPSGSSPVDHQNQIGFNVTPGTFKDRTPSGQRVRGEVRKTEDPNTFLMQVEQAPAPPKR